MLNSRVLTHLNISNLTLVDQLELDFEAGMSVVTGETGAGKSIMLGALGLALGDRADSSLIGSAPKTKGPRKAEVNATFDVSGNERVTHWLESRELADDGQCILRRVISDDGRSKAFVNGSSMTLNELKTLSQMLLDIHSQHEHQSLLRKETHRRLLDEFGGLMDISDELEQKYLDWQVLEANLSQIRQDAEEQTARVQLLSYQADELNELSLRVGEVEELELEQKALSAADGTLAILSEVESLCSQEEENGAYSLLARALTQLSNIEDQRVSDVREMLENAKIHLEEAVLDLGKLFDQFSADPQRLQAVENRLSKIYEISRKHKISPEELLELCRSIQAELDDILNADERIAELESAVLDARHAYQTLAEKLSQSRKQSAQLLESEITQELQNLGMGGATFVSKVLPLAEGNRYGIDDIEFSISTIPGVDPGPLGKIASGGELSRISLAIQVVTAKTSQTPTLVFDEVDVGVGGATAEVVGRLLRRLGDNAQIVCVTHLPQVAAQGHHHYVVSKATTEDAAETTVARLDEEQKIEEIARMLGGVERTDQSLAHAESMLSGKK